MWLKLTMQSFRTAEEFLCLAVRGLLAPVASMLEASYRLWSLSRVNRDNASMRNFDTTAESIRRCFALQPISETSSYCTWYRSFLDELCNRLKGDL